MLQSRFTFFNKDFSPKWKAIAQKVFEKSTNKLYRDKDLEQKSLHENPLKLNEKYQAINLIFLRLLLVSLVTNFFYNSSIHYGSTKEGTKRDILPQCTSYTQSRVNFTNIDLYK